MAITRPNVPGPANSNATTQFDARPNQWQTEPTTDQHIVAHDYGQPERVQPEDG